MAKSGIAQTLKKLAGYGLKYGHLMVLYGFIPALVYAGMRTEPKPKSWKRLVDPLMM